MAPPYGASLLPSEEDEGSDVEVPGFACGGLAQEIVRLKSSRKEVQAHLTQLDALWQRRRKPWVEKVERLDEKIRHLQQALKEEQRALHDMPTPTGPESLAFVSDPWFNAFCHSIVMFNLLWMVVLFRSPEVDARPVAGFAHLFLAWYLAEISMKYGYHRLNLFLGRFSVVWWNWLDAGIVLGGVLDEWLVPLLFPSSDLNLRFLRVFRVLRVLRLAKAFFTGNLEWTKQPLFEMSLAGIIAVNSVTMWLELDYHWPIWPFVENLFLIIYTFELAVRLKREGLGFFIDFKNLSWNILDLIMVLGCVLDLWLMPVLHFVDHMVNGEHADGAEGWDGVLNILKMLRILRVLRLVRLLRTVKPLYRLLIGVAEALMAMQWVMVLTLLTLYAGAITWTTLVGKGLISSVDDFTVENFGTVPESLFSLFKLMNGDISVVEPIINTVFGQLLFAGFMVVSKWVVLAILTSVVSDNMMTASAKAAEEDNLHKRAMDRQIRAERLQDIFHGLDHERCGFISEDEWRTVWDHPLLSSEMLDATGRGRIMLDDMFTCLSEINFRTSGRLAGVTGSILPYDAFIQHCEDAGSPADNHALLHVSSQVKFVQTEIVKLRKARMVEEQLQPGPPQSCTLQAPDCTLQAPDGDTSTAHFASLPPQKSEASMGESSLQPSGLRTLRCQCSFKRGDSGSDGSWSDSGGLPPWGQSGTFVQATT